MQVESGVQVHEKRAQLKCPVMFGSPSLLREIFYKGVREEPVEIGTTGGVTFSFRGRCGISMNQKEGAVLDRQFSALCFLGKRFDSRSSAGLIAVHAADDCHIGTGPRPRIVARIRGGRVVDSRRSWAKDTLHTGDLRMRRYANFQGTHGARRR